MGSATLYHLARRGVRALGIEQFALRHDRGSSHGRTRVFRTTYEDPCYAHLAAVALERWRSLERDAERSLLDLVGLLGFAPRSNEHFWMIARQLEKLGLPHEIMKGGDAARRFDAFSFDDDVVACFAPQNGFLRADQCLQSMQELAVRDGAAILEKIPVRDLEPVQDGVVVRTDDRSVLAEHVVITAGPWLGRLAADLELPLEVTREQKVYFAVDEPRLFAAGRMPVYADYESDVYGFPLLGPGVKLAADHSGRAVDPDDVKRTVDPSYVKRLKAWMRRWMRVEHVRPTESAVCLYTVTADFDFIIDRHPSVNGLLIAGGFSGHGSKFSILIGEIMADLVTHGTTPHAIDRFRLNRFTE